MSAEAFGMMAIICYSLAAVLVVIAIILYFVQHIRSVRDDLTGRTAQRAIAELREGTANRSKFFGGEERGAAAKGQGKRRRGMQEVPSGSLRLRHFSNEDDIRTTDLDEDACSTTMLASHDADQDAMPTSLLGSNGTNIRDGLEQDGQSTTMLGSSAPAQEDAFSTTLLDKENARGGAR